MSDFIEKYSVPRVGLGVLVLKDNKVLLAKRWGKDGSFVWCMPGGHLEYGETLEACARRETLEEAGVEIENVKCISATNWPDDEKKHFIRFCMVADWKSGEPRDEERIMTDWAWFPINEIPKPIFAPNEAFIGAYLSGKQILGEDSYLLAETVR